MFLDLKCIYPCSKSNCKACPYITRDQKKNFTGNDVRTNETKQFVTCANETIRDLWFEVSLWTNVCGQNDSGDENKVWGTSLSDRRVQCSPTLFPFSQWEPTGSKTVWD